MKIVDYVDGIDLLMWFLLLSGGVLLSGDVYASMQNIHLCCTHIPIDTLEHVRDYLFIITDKVRVKGEGR